LSIAGLDARLGELDDFIAAFLRDIDDGGVVCIQDFVVVLLEARTF